MCLYRNIIRNPKYTENKKNGGIVPRFSDIRVLSVPIQCNRCAECLKKKANEWRIRLFEETKYTDLNGHFVTLTFSEESLRKFRKQITKKFKGLNEYDIDNMTASIAVRRFTERWRKKYKKSVRHWLITELGHKNTERIHLHGIIWTNEPKEEISNHWQYGIVWAGYEKKDTYVNKKTINYIMKYVTKQDFDHKYYIPKIFTSKGIGSKYIESGEASTCRFKEEETKEYYKTEQGYKLALPIYYRNKLYTDEERERLWIYKLNKQILFVDKTPIDISQGLEEYNHMLKLAQEKYQSLGYNGKMDYDKKEYELKRRKLLKENLEIQI